MHVHIYIYVYICIYMYVYNNIFFLNSLFRYILDDLRLYRSHMLRIFAYPSALQPSVFPHGTQKHKQIKEQQCQQQRQQRQQHEQLQLPLPAPQEYFSSYQHFRLRLLQQLEVYHPSS